MRDIHFSLSLMNTLKDPGFMAHGDVRKMFFPGERHPSPNLMPPILMIAAQNGLQDSSVGVFENFYS